MALIDPATGAVVIRIVYDGAPFAGKTTSLRSLAGGLGATVRSPGEVDGRTLYFDWLDYTGGLFEGRRIRCQIVSVPGQAILAPRRRRLLSSADVVVYVSDTTATGFAAEAGHLGSLRDVLSHLPAPPVGVVVQANKRDTADAVPLDELRDRMRDLGLVAGIVETRATQGDGVREAFVLAVRLALDRVRELMRSGALRTASPEAGTADDLLAALRAADAPLRALDDAATLPHIRLIDVAAPREPAKGSVPTPAAEAIARVLEENAAAAAPAPAATPPPAPAPVPTPALAPVPMPRTMGERPPLLPDAGVASGLVWPVVVGRTILSELDPSSYVRVRQDGAWEAISQRRWRLHSAPEARYADPEAGRAMLVRWARQHAALCAVLTPERCIVLGGDHDGGLRAWQVVRIRPTLRTLLDELLGGSPAALARALVAAELASRTLQDAFRQAGVAVDVGLSDVVIDADGIRYGGAVPLPDTRPVAPVDRRRHYGFARPALLGQREGLLARLRDPDDLAATAEGATPLERVLAHAAPGARREACVAAAGFVRSL